MSGQAKITRSHLDRVALVYVCQSTLAQVRENTESTARQYALADEAVRLGWPRQGVTVIDADLGLSGRSAQHRGGFRFRAIGSAYGVVSLFKGRRFPLRAYGGAWAGQLRWGRLTHARVLGVLANPTYAGTYVHGRHSSRRRVAPDGQIHTSTVCLPRAQWPVTIHDHHAGYLSWEDFLANEAKLAANRTNAGARPVREGVALCQGIITCGSCGRPLSTRYHRNGRAAYECSASRADQMATATCRSIAAATVDDVVADRLLTALTPEEVALALAAADEVADRRSRGNRAAELAVERARYEADRAERAFHAAEPENRLVTRSLETRWEAKLATLAETQAALDATHAAAPPLPARADLEALVGDVPRLWHAESTSARDRKRLLRTLIADVTLLPEADPDKARIGIRWHTGATEEIATTRPPRVADTRRTPPGAIELITRLGPTQSNEQLIAELTAAGLTTGAGHPFSLKAISWARRVYLDSLT